MTSSLLHLIEIQYTKGYVAYLVSINTSHWFSYQKIKYRVTKQVKASETVPVNALKVSYSRALELVAILNKCGCVAQVVDVEREMTV